MAKRRANGEGSLRKRKDGRWEGRYIVGYDPVTGKRIIKRIIKNVLGKTQAEVREKLKQAVETAGACRYPDTAIPQCLQPQHLPIVYSTYLKR